MEEKFLTWSSYCFVLDGGNNTLSLYQDGVTMGSKSLPEGATPVPAGGFILLGQELPVEKLTLSESNGDYALMGQLADLTLWLDVLSEDDIRALVNCQPIAPQPVVSFTPSDWLLNGSTTWVNATAFKNVCQMLPYDNQARIFSPHHDYLDATEVCRALGGRIPTPTNQTEETLLKDDFAAYEKGKADLVVCVGANKTESGWSDLYSGDNVPYLNELTVYHSLLEAQALCMYFHETVAYWVHYYSAAGETVVCDIPVRKYILRGLCKDSTLGKELWQHQTLDGHLIFREYGQSFLVVDKEWKKWQLRTWGNDEAEAVLPVEEIPSERHHFPLGYLKWKVRDKACKYRGKVLSLVLTPCSTEEFTCYDGLSCIPKEEFCDEHVDCPDASDETRCPNQVLVPTGYTQTPPSSSPSEPFTVECSIEVVNFRKFDIKEMETEADLALTFRWQDPRLTYLALKSSGHNVFDITDSKIWRPDFGLFSSLGAEATLETVRTIAEVEQEGPPLPDNLDSIHGGQCCSCMYIVCITWR